MSADHRKPVFAFVVLVILAVAVVGAQRAQAQIGRVVAAGVSAHVTMTHRVLPEPPVSPARAPHRVSAAPARSAASPAPAPPVQSAPVPPTPEPVAPSYPEGRDLAGVRAEPVTSPVAGVVRPVAGVARAMRPVEPVQELVESVTGGQGRALGHLGHEGGRPGLALGHHKDR